MARSCSVCNHPQRQEIDRMLLSSEPIAQIARRFAKFPHDYALSRDSLSRHKQNHLRRDLDDVRLAMMQAREESLNEIKKREICDIKKAATSNLAARLEAAEDYLVQIREIRCRAAGMLEKAEALNDFKAAAPLLREIRAQIELMAELENKIKMGPIGVNPEQIAAFYDRPEWTEVGRELAIALDRWPEAKLAAASVLYALKEKY
jgi:hypothetical protein